MHEYSHWFQDIACMSGWIGVFQILKNHGLMYDAYKDLSVVSLPIQEPNTWDAYELRRILRPTVDWWHGEKDIEFNHFGEITKKPARIWGAEIEIPEAWAVFKNSTGREFQKQIGELEVRENYAAAVTELYNGTKILDRTHVEYRIIYDICRKVFGDKFGPRHLIAVCHHALNHPVPGIGIVELVEQSKLHFKNDCPPSRDLNKFCRNYLWDRYIKEAGQAQLEAFKQFAASYREQHPQELATRAVNWVYEKTEKAFRYNWDFERDFPLDTAVAGFLTSDNSHEDKLNCLWHEFPLPLLIQEKAKDEDSRAEEDVVLPEAKGVDSLECVSTIIADRDMDSIFFLAALNRVTSFLLSNAPKQKCLLYGPCRCSSPTKGPECLEEPWTRGRLKPAPCHYGSAAVYMGIEDKIFQSASP